MQDTSAALDRHGKVLRDTGPLPRLNPGGGTFGPDGRYYVGMRTARTIMALPATLDGPGEQILPNRIVPFPRGFAFGSNGVLFLSSGIGPGGAGDNTIVAFTRGHGLKPLRLVFDPQLSPLDLAVAPNGNLVVSSEYPLGSANAATSVREYSAADGKLVRVFAADRSAEFRDPRGLRFGPDGILTASPEMR